MDHTDYPFEVDEWLRRCREKMREAPDFIGAHPYRHFDGAVNYREFDTNESNVKPLLLNPQRLVHHSFLPFIRKDQKVRHFTWDRINKRSNVSQKLRPIMYASHRDACIYAFYSYLLKQAYERRIESTPLADSIIAYRHIERSDNPKRGKSNIDFAKDVHELVRRHSRCAVLCMDVSKFFDSMDHALIKERWSDLLGAERLPSGHYMVFRNITKYRYIFLYDALVRLGYGKMRKGRFIFKRGKRRNGPLCFFDEYRSKIDPKHRSLVHRHNTGVGIPQGSPISDIIANLYLEGFDRAVLQELEMLKFGYYRRYSDDILIVCPEDKVKEMYRFISERIKSDKLAIKPKKSEAVILDNTSKKVRDITYAVTGLDEHKDSARVAFQYLGFEIDTEDLHIRSGTVAAHYRRAKRRAKAEANPKPESPHHLKRKSVKGKSNRSRWQYFISAQKRTQSQRIERQYKRVLKRARKFVAQETRG